MLALASAASLFIDILNCLVVKRENAISRNWTHDLVLSNLCFAMIVSTKNREIAYERDDTMIVCSNT
jgi:hypothetical protein